MRNQSFPLCQFFVIVVWLCMCAFVCVCSGQVTPSCARSNTFFVWFGFVATPGCVQTYSCVCSSNDIQLWSGNHMQCQLCTRHVTHYTISLLLAVLSFQFLIPLLPGIMYRYLLRQVIRMRTVKEASWKDHLESPGKGPKLLGKGNCLLAHEQACLSAQWFQWFHVIDRAKREE